MKITDQQIQQAVQETLEEYLGQSPPSEFIAVMVARKVDVSPSEYESLCQRVKDLLQK